STEANPHRYLLSGRTALDHIIQDIKQSTKFKSVYMPSYCCQSMIQPFIDSNIEVKFYRVRFEENRFVYDVDYEINCDAILIMQYFGFNNDSEKVIIDEFVSRGKVVIEDATHSWFSESPYSSNADYVLASFRKWTGVPCGAIIVKPKSQFLIGISIQTNSPYIDLRTKAAILKKEYITNQSGNKEGFLNLFTQAEHLLDKDYKSYIVTVDLEDKLKKLYTDKIKQIRRDNAAYLIKELKTIVGITTIKVTENDTPLFVPIMIDKDIRDKLQQYLKVKDIYCPIHWPLTSDHRIKDISLYENCLSIVCDQRYTLADMHRIIEQIRDFMVNGK
ncbi:MAG: hypothetical protein WCI62_04650, partial [Erysipelotrichaceae bacterium]